MYPIFYLLKGDYIPVCLGGMAEFQDLGGCGAGAGGSDPPTVNKKPFWSRVPPTTFLGFPVWGPDQIPEAPSPKP